MKHIWVVEFLENGRWYPTMYCGLTRKAVRQELSDAKDFHSLDYDGFRVRKYIRES